MKIRIGDEIYFAGKHKLTGKYCLSILETPINIWTTIKESKDVEDIKKEIKRIKVNYNRRERNQVLRDLCGTSARAARLDMGLARA